MTIVTLLTDFGLADGYVGTMAGVILGRAPNAQLVDLTHAIAPQNVRQAAFVLYTAYPYFPPGTVHMVVVDPGVGSRRRPIALQTPSALFVGPDNGVFSYVLAREPLLGAVELADPRYRLPTVSSTFHGRDIFSPAAAHLAAGVPLGALGPAISDLVTLPLPRLALHEDSVEGEVLHVDHFGNAITSIGVLAWEGPRLRLSPAFGAAQEPPSPFEAGRATVAAGAHTLHGIFHTYAEVERGQPLALVGSEGYLELAAREAHGAQALGLRPGTPVTLTR